VNRTVAGSGCTDPSTVAAGVGAWLDLSSWFSQPLPRQRLMALDSGLPSAVIRFKPLRARLASTSRRAPCQDILHFRARVLVIQTQELLTRGIESHVHIVAVSA
jgi:hypothetical protein